MKRLFVNPRERDANDLQLDMFRNKEGIFGLDNAKRIIHTCSHGKVIQLLSQIQNSYLFNF